METKKIAKIRGINRTLIELWCTIIIFDFCLYLLGIFFVPDKSSCTIGFFMGMLIALLMAYHMSYVLDKYLELPEKKASKWIMIQAFIRYFAVAALLFLIMESSFANPLCAFAGIMGLKAGAYFQPLFHKFTVRKYPDPEPPPGIPDEIDTNKEEVIQ